MKAFFLFGSYLKYNRKLFFLLCLFSTIFALIFSLYNLPVEAVCYGVLICFCFAVPFFLFDYMKFYKKHKFLTKLQKQITLDIALLPSSSNLIEQDYIDLIKIMYQDKIQYISETDNAYSDMLDYYTLWAHQIKTPIAAMDLLLQSEESRQNSNLSSELFKIQQYVEMVLSYLRLDSNSTDFLIKKYNLDSIIRQTVRKFAKQFIIKKIKLSFTETNFYVLTDEKWLSFVIEQILSNSLKYTPKGTISIYLEQDSKMLVIEDTGIGITEEDLPRIFEKGFTGYNGRIYKKSTGIGLYLCKRILTKLSHTITIESYPNKGTKVKIDLSSMKTNIE